MIIPVLKLGTLAIRTFSKPTADRLKAGAGLHPKFLDFIINVAQERAVLAATGLLGELVVFTVAAAAIIYEVHRSSKAEARKEEQRRQELEAMAQKSKHLENEVELLRQRLQQMEALSRRRSFLDYFRFRYSCAQSI